MEQFSYEVPLGSIGNIKTGDTIEQGVIKEIHFVGLDENTMVVTGLCEKEENRKMEETVQCPSCKDEMYINHTFRSIPVYVCRRWGWPGKYPKDCYEVIAVKDYAPTKK